MRPADVVSASDEGASTSRLVIKRGAWENGASASRVSHVMLHVMSFLIRLCAHSFQVLSWTFTAISSTVDYTSNDMADDTPVMFKRKGARPSQRSRPTEADAEPTTGTGSDTAGTGEDSPSVLATKLKNKLKTRTKPKSKLSFGGADEDVSCCNV